MVCPPIRAEWCVTTLFSSGTPRRVDAPSCGFACGCCSPGKRVRSRCGLGCCVCCEGGVVTWAKAAPAIRIARNVLFMKGIVYRRAPESIMVSARQNPDLVLGNRIDQPML